MTNQIRISKLFGNHRSIWFVVVFFLLFDAASLFASISFEEESNFIQQEEVKIQGTIVDQTGAPIPGVSIVIKGTSIGTITDIDGNFSLKASINSSIVVSFIGFATQEIVVTPQTSQLNIVLKEDIAKLDEVVVVGYGTQKKETVTGSLSSVSSEELTKQPVSSVTQALAGKLPGLIANQSGGRPGKDGATIKIRGIATLDEGAGSSPLVLIDGVERQQSELNFLDPNEIETLSILKDASSTAVFGVRGANGVILVTTKRGKEGPAKVMYKTTMAVMIPDRSIKLVNSYQQQGLLNEYSGFAEDSEDPIAPYPKSVRDRYKAVIDGNPVEPSDPFFYPSTNYADLMLKDYAFQKQHNFTIRGGSDKFKYFASLGYFDQDGMFKNINPDLDKSTNYQRYNYRTNLDIKLTNTTTAKVNIGGSFNQNISLGQGGNEPARSFYWNLVVHSSPWDGYVHDGKLVMLQENANNVMLNSDFRGYNLELENTSDYSFIIDQKLDFITEGLSAKATASFVSYFSNYIRREKNDKNLPYYSPFLNSDGTVSFYREKEDILPANSTSQDKRRKEYYEFTLNYQRSINDIHNVSLMGLFNADKSFYYLSEFSDIPRSYLGFSGRATYNFKSRYMAEFNIGYNGSENFLEGKRFGFFPAYSAGWTFTEEPWLKNLIGENILTYGKFRFSYGTVGNDKMGGNRFLYLPDTYTMGNSNYWGPQFGQLGALQYYAHALPGRTGNPNVTWEKSKKINYGADLSFVQDLISLNIDYFTEDRTDILIDQQVVPIYQQTGALALNLGQVHNEGYEIELGFNKKLNSNTRIWANANYTHTRNKIIEIDEPEVDLPYRQKTGTRVGEAWGYQQEDFFKTVEEAETYKDELWATYSELNPGASKNDYQAYKIFDDGSDVSAGDLKFIDRNNDGLITTDDAGYLDIPTFPETMFGFGAGVTHKKLSFSFMFQGGADYAINVRTDNSPTLSKGTALDFVMNRYTPERYAAGEKIEFPRLLASNDNWKYVGSYWMRNASYIRLKNTEIAYTFDKTDKFIEKLGLDNVRVFANGYNLLTISDIKYIDPETTNGVLRYPRSRVINLGVQVQF
ncbi:MULTISPECIES: SusC/RagA family TonB-linked outer membrane protein [unclassified Saccharicrinis]|uniref:SusC/RagA family TonB-linked outer membrane protein n=1 Tax=unclassified Saccharicrinis TaxID=2646859 RepID=UPI003D32B9A3